MTPKQISERITHVTLRLNGKVLFSNGWNGEEVSGRLDEKDGKYYVGDTEIKEGDEDKFSFMIPGWKPISLITDESIEKWKKDNNYGKKRQ